MTKIAKTPPPPYYAVIFTSILRENSEGYESTAERMLELASAQPGYLGYESARAGLGVTVSYWESQEAIACWKRNTEHLQAQQQGRSTWYRQYHIRVARVERDYGFSDS